MGADAYECALCPAEFYSERSLAAHNKDCPGAAALDKKRADPGRDLEELVIKSAKALRGERFHLRKVPPPVSGRIGPRGHITGRVTAKGSLDFVGHLAGRHFEFDAKSTGVATRFDLKNVSPHQIVELHRRHDEGAIAFLLVEFRNAKGGPRYFVLGWRELSAWLYAASIPFSWFEHTGDEVQRAGNVLDLVGAVRAIAGVAT